jgi:hypothetical protein
MASFFKQLSEDMEKVIQTVEEGAKFMMGETAYLGEKKTNDAESLLDPTTTYHNDGDSDGGADELMGEENFDGIDELDGGSPLMGMANSVLSDIMSMQVSVSLGQTLTPVALPPLHTLCFLTTLLAIIQTGPQTIKEHIHAFTSAITWDESFIKVILGFHVVVIVAAIAIHRQGGVYSRLGFMIFVGIIVRLADTMNRIGNSRWKEFATQNYFDNGGIFMGIMICAPLLIVCLIMLISMIREAANLIVDVGKMKVEAQKKQKQRKEQKSQTKDEKKRRKKE